jgi:hypothetical protein
MSTEMTISSNHVVVVGMLDTMMVRDRNAKRDKERGRPMLIETTRKEGRTRGVGGRWENMTLQVGSPYGGMYALPIELSPDVPGIELLDNAAAETMLAIEGSLQLRQTFDGRFATDRLDARNRSDRGRPTRDLQLRVSLVRAPNTDERRASSVVWLEGVVAEPPQVSRHPDLPAIQLAGTILKVAFARPLDFPGVVATIDEIVDVNVAIPTSHRNAESLFQAGNRVRLIGQLDCRMEFQGGASVAQKLAEIDAEWATRKAELAGHPSELRRAEGAYVRLRQRFEAAPRRYVLVGHVELIDGAPIALADTFEQRREFVRTQRALRDERRRRVDADRARRVQARIGSAEGDNHQTKMPEDIDITTGGMGSASDTIKMVRPRKLARTMSDLNPDPGVEVGAVEIEATPALTIDGVDHTSAT